MLFRSVQVPNNAPGFRVRLTPTEGEVLLVERSGALPELSANIANYYGVGKKMQKGGPEHYLLLPSVRYDSGLNQTVTNVVPGTYLLGVVSEGQNPGNGRIGTNTTTYVLETLALAVTDLGALNPVGGADLTVGGTDRKSTRLNSSH